jgi:hypothetical protein
VFFVPGNWVGCAWMAMSRHFFASSTVIANVALGVIRCATSASEAFDLVHQPSFVSHENLSAVWPLN